MNLESIIGILYCIIGFVHLAVFAYKRDLRKDYSNPMDAFVATFAWPLVDVLWLIGHRQPRRP